MNSENKYKNLWLILSVSVAACLLYGISGGLRANYGVMLNAIANNSGLDYASVSFVLAIGQLTVGIVQPLFGALALKQSNSFVLAVGAVMIAVGLLGIPLCHSILSLTLMLGIILSGGTGAMAFGIIMGAITPTIGERTAAIVSGFVSASVGIGGTILSPVMQQLTARFGLRAMMLILCAPVAVFFFISLGLGKSEARNIGETEENISVLHTFCKAITDKSSLFIFLAFFTCGYYMSIIETHLYSQYVSYGFDDALAAFAISVYGIGAMAGCIFTGFLDSRFKNKYVLAGTYWSRLLIASALIFLPKSIPHVYVTAFLLGCSGNATVPPTTGLITKLYGSKKLGVLFGTAFLVHQIGAFASGWLGGILVKSTGGYNLLWISSMILSLIAGALVVQVRENR
ncbi:MAG: MFS transporter [Bacteroides sp.]|nr:MFS transporter [Prevotella sp.]MCM1407836.1 MFS transporter [Treponema brennaborense]MCM1470889.1 MFS transporter [Bacteroides sp.]